MASGEMPMAKPPKRHVRASWGTARVIEDRPGYVLRLILVHPHSSYPEVRETDSHVFVTLLEGRVQVMMDEVQVTAEELSRQTIPPGSRLRIHNRTQRPARLLILFSKPRPRLVTTGEA